MRPTIHSYIRLQTGLLSKRLGVDTGSPRKTPYSHDRRRSVMATNLPKLNEVEQVSRNVVRILGGNPSKFTLQGTNTYLLGQGPKRILLDTAQGLDPWPSALRKTLDEHNTTVSTCLLSHWHRDHIGGVGQLLDVLQQQQNSESVRLCKAMPDLDPDGILRQLKDRVQVDDVKDGDTFSVGGAADGTEEFEVQAVHCPGHTKDHMAFVVTKSGDENEIGCMFTADNVLGHGTAVFENLAEYLKSLELMKGRIGEGRRAFPGHGEVIQDGRGKIQFYMEHRRMREEEALNVLRFGTSKRPEKEGNIGVGKEVVPGKEWGSMEMVKVIYAEVPESLHVPAEGGLLMVLEKLKGEGKVVHTEQGKWRLGAKGLL